MLKLIGILIGSALAVAFLIIALGVPNVSAPEPEAAPEPVVVLSPEPEPARPPAPQPPQPEQEIVHEPVAKRVAEPQRLPDPATEALIEKIFDSVDEDMTDVNWYAFWSPFRSEIAANGFVSKLQETTGIDYRVVKVKAGVYEVAFAYVDDSDIEDKLARIANATGMTMTDG